MNEQIRKIAEQVGHKPVQGAEFFNSIEDLFHQKFAEAIIRECIHVMDVTAQESWNNCTYMREEVPTSAHQNAIREHFGIK